MSYQGKRISNWFRTVSLHILILEKQQSSKFQKIDQSYPVEAIKVTPKLRSKLLILKILVLFTHSPTRFSPQKRRQRNNSLFLFTIIIFNFIQTWGNFDRLIKVTLSTIKVTPSAIKVTPFGEVILIGLWFRISSKKLISTYGKR